MVAAMVSAVMASAVPTVTISLQDFFAPAVIIAAMGFIWNFSSRITKIETRVENLQKGVDWFVQGLTGDAIKFLHKPHPDAKQLDELLDAFRESRRTGERLSSEQVDLLRALLWAKYNDPDPNADKFEQDQARVMLRGIEYFYPEHRGENPVSVEAQQQIGH